MIFKTSRDGEVEPVRFRIEFSDGNEICRIISYRLIVPEGELTTPDGVYLGRDTQYYDVEYQTAYNRRHNAKMYFDLSGTCWYISGRSLR